MDSAFHSRWSTEVSVGVYVFAYDFPHRKSEDIILSCFLNGVRLGGVIAAPRKELQPVSSWRGFEPLPLQAPVHPAGLCRQLGIPYYVTPHEDENYIARIVPDNAIAIIGGARIMPEAVIRRFSRGIVNYHPGPIPETSGLDSFYWMIEKGAAPKVTAHYIDARVDAGSLIEFRKIAVSEDDTPATINYKLYVAQLASNKWLADQLAKGEVPSATPIDRPIKNRPMPNEMRRSALKRFPDWLRRHVA